MLLNWVGGFHAGSPQKSNLSKNESNICQKKGPRGLNSSPHLLEVGEHIFYMKGPTERFFKQLLQTSSPKATKKTCFHQRLF